MDNIAGMRIKQPKATPGEISRKHLTESVVNTNKMLTFIHAPAGYGKTTLLSHIAGSYKNVVLPDDR